MVSKGWWKRSFTSQMEGPFRFCNSWVWWEGHHSQAKRTSSPFSFICKHSQFWIRWEMKFFQTLRAEKYYFVQFLKYSILWINNSWMREFRDFWRCTKTQFWSSQEKVKDTNWNFQSLFYYPRNPSVEQGLGWAENWWWTNWGDWADNISTSLTSGKSTLILYIQMVWNSITKRKTASYT